MAGGDENNFGNCRSASCPNSQRFRPGWPLRIGNNPRSGKKIVASRWCP